MTNIILKADEKVMAHLRRGAELLATQRAAAEGIATPAPAPVNPLAEATAGLRRQLFAALRYALTNLSHVSPSDIAELLASPDDSVDLVVKITSTREASLIMVTLTGAHDVITLPERQI